MDKQDILYEIGSKYKKIFDIDDWAINSDPVFYKGCFESFFEGYCRHNKHDRKLLFRYVDVHKKRIGATTFYSDFLEREVILFNMNSIPLMKSYYYTLMKYYKVTENKSVWNSISKVDVEVEKAEYDIDQINKSVTYNGVLDDEFYRSMAEFLTFISTQFLFNHEVAHSLNGHTRLIANESYNDFLIRMELSNSMSLKTMEMDADAYAAGSLANYINNFNQNDLEKIFPCLKLISKEERNIFCIYSILTTFMCSSEYVDYVDNYLTPFMRAVLSIDVLIEEFKLLGINKSSKIDLNVLVLIAYENYAKIYEKEKVTINRLDELFKEHEEYKNELREVWMKYLRPELEKYSLESLAT